MPRFNTPTPGTRTQNLAGGAAYAQDARHEIAALLLTSFVQDKFYRGADAELDRTRALVAADPLFAAKAAVYARNEYGMRSITHVVAGEVCEHVKGEPWVKHFINAVVRRPDDMLEILSYRAGTYGLHPIPNSLKKGLRAAVARYDAYSLAKYRGDGKSVSMIDVVNLTHPRPTDKSRDALAALVSDTLRSTDTWESRLSGGADKGETWAELLAADKLGYMALLRNLRNIATDADDVTFNVALRRLTDAERIHKSLVLPFRFWTAYREIGGTGRGRSINPYEWMEQAHTSEIGDVRRNVLLGAISRAADIAVDNMPDLPGVTRVVLDVSGSMQGRVASQRGSGMTAGEIGAMFAAALMRRLAGRAYFLTFDTTLQAPAINPEDSLLSVTEKLVAGMRGGGTNMDLAFAGDAPADRIIILSDMQAWINGQYRGGDSGYHMTASGIYNPATRSYGFPDHKPAAGALDEYRRRTGLDPHVYAFDLTGYGSMQFPAERCYQIAGWSEKVFDVMALLEEDRDALIHTIDAVEFA